MTDLVRYSVVVPEAMLAHHTRDDLERAAAVINTAPIEDGGRERLEHLHAVRYTGRAPSQVATLLAAIAQGHPLGEILDAIEADMIRWRATPATESGAGDPPRPAPPAPGPPARRAHERPSRAATGPHTSQRPSRPRAARPG